MARLVENGMRRGSPIPLFRTNPSSTRHIDIGPFQWPIARHARDGWTYSHQRARYRLRRPGVVDPLRLVGAWPDAFPIVQLSGGSSVIVTIGCRAWMTAWQAGRTPLPGVSCAVASPGAGLPQTCTTAVSELGDLVNFHRAADRAPRVRSFQKLSDQLFTGDDRGLTPPEEDHVSSWHSTEHGDLRFPAVASDTDLDARA